MRRFNKRITWLILIILVLILILLLPGIQAKTSTMAQTHEVWINIPTPCHVVEKVKNNKIFLRKATEQCVQMVSRTKVSLKRSIKSVKIYVGKKLWQEQSIQGINLDDVRNLLKNSETIQKTTKRPESLIDPKVQKRADDLNHLFRSEEYQKKLTEETNRLKREVFNLHTDEGAQTDPENVGKQKILASSERLYLFISSSMPLKTIRNYAADFERLGDPNISMVLRGFIGGMKKAGPTLEFVSNVIVKDPECRTKEVQCPARKINILVDPLLFQKYKIKRVPALVYVPTYKTDDPDGSEGLKEAPLHYTLYGDASLRYLIEELERTTKKSSLQNLVRAFTKQ